MNGRSGTGQRDDQRSVKCRVNPVVIACGVEQVAEHSRQRDFKSELHVPRIAKGVRDKKRGLAPGGGFLRVVLRLRILRRQDLVTRIRLPGVAARYFRPCPLRAVTQYATEQSPPRILAGRILLPFAVRLESLSPWKRWRRRPRTSAVLSHRRRLTS